MFRRGIVGLVVIGFATGTACSTKVSSSNPGVDGGSDASATYGASACGACVADACAAAIGTCNADPTCAASLSCLDGCAIADNGDADPTCEAACPAPSGSAGTSAFAGVTTCRKQGAGAACQACGAVDGGTDGSAACITSPLLTQTCAPSSQTSACTKCELEKCCKSVDKAINGGPATDFADCWNACNDHKCVVDCEQKYPSGIQGFGEYASCTAVNCQAPGLCPTSSKCTLCEFQKCACELTACELDVGCWNINDCVGRCNTADVACGKACATGADPKSAALNNSLAVCVTQKCIDMCGLK
jgi:hypothetical protein